MEKISNFFQNSPQYFGFVIIGLGILLIISAILKWKWINQDGDGRVFNNTWFIKIFGKRQQKRLDIILGIILILVGIAWLLIHLKLKTL